MSNSNGDEVARKICQHLGIGVEHKTGNDEVAAEIGVQPYVVRNISRILKYIGSLNVRLEYGPGTGRVSYWTMVDDFTTIKSKMRDKNLDWRQTTWERISRELGNKSMQEIHRERMAAKAAKQTPEQAEAAHRVELPPAVQRARELAEKPAVGTDKNGEQVAVIGQDRPNPFKVLSPLRKDEAHALVEAARQYRDRELFIEQQEKLFAEHGIKLNAGAIELDRDERLETVGLVLGYIERLETENARLEERAAPATQALRELASLRTETQAQKARIDSLVQEKMKERDRAIQLEQQLRQRKSEPVAAH